jgi:hypothetical protein
MSDIREVVLDGKVVAAMFSFYFRDQVIPYYGRRILNTTPPSRIIPCTTT